MDKRSFIRGFGMGVLFAAVILGISCLMRTSDSAVIKRAKQLGMTYAAQEEKLFQTSAPKNSAAAKTPEPSSTSVSSDKKPSATMKPEMWHDRGKETKKPDKTLQKEQTDQKEFDQEKKKITDDFEKSTKELQIQAGDWSADVSRKLEEMDVISDAEAFDAYMDKHGYSSKIKAGNYSISPGADFDQIAKEITSK